MTATREDLVRIVRDVVTGTNRPTYCACPVASVDHALDESLKLQSHYAILLNQYDGGSRMTFADAGAWLARLRDVKNRGVT